MKKVISFVMAFAMLLSCLAISVSADAGAETYPDIVITPDNLQGSSLGPYANDTLEVVELNGEKVFKLTGNSSDYAGYIDVNLWTGIPFAYEYIKAEVYYETVTSVNLAKKPFVQETQASSNQTGDAAGLTSWVELSQCGKTFVARWVFC